VGANPFSASMVDALRVRPIDRVDRRSWAAGPGASMTAGLLSRGQPAGADFFQ
jgi:hypothetical protein